MTEEKESPILDEGEKSDEKTPDETEALLNELKNAGVSTTQELQGKLQASSQYGQMAYKLGEERREKQELLRRLEALESQKSNVENLDDYGQPVDLQAEIRKAYRAEKELEARQQREQQARMVEVYNKIQSDPDYKLVESVWQERLKDPNFVFGIQSGQVNPLDEFNNTVRGYYKGMAKKAAETIEKLAGGAKVQTPVVEQGARLPDQPEEVDENEVLKSLGQKVNKGGQLTEAEELAALQAALS